MKSFLRLFQKRSSYYITNILGLAVGIAAAGFSILYVHHELSYDAFHSKADRVFRVSHQNDGGWFASLNKKHIDVLRADTIPAVEEVVRIRRWPSKFLYVGDQKFYESKVNFTDPGSTFFSMFDFPFKEGSRETALQQSNSVVISSSIAKKYFGNKPALGEAVTYDTMSLVVTGVIDDFPSNTAFNFEMLVTNQAAMEMASGSYTFVELNENADIEALEQQILKAKVGDMHQKVTGIKILPLRDIHFDSKFTYEMKPAGNEAYLWILVAIGTTILLIAFTNFINLSVALYARRSREIAVRKSVGASSALLSRQFYLESVITISMSFALGLMLIYALTPAFNTMMEIRLSDPLSSAPFLLGVAILLPAMTILAGIYPSIILPRIQIIALFKQTGITTNHGLNLRMFLLGFQLIVLFFVCCSLWIIQGQFQYIKNKDLGFSKEGVVKIRRAWSVDSTMYWTIKDRLLQHSAIEAVSESFAPGDEEYGFTFKGESSTTTYEGVFVQGTDYDYLKVLDIKPLQGAIVNNTELPTKSCIINSTMVNMLGYDEPIGKTFVLHPGLKNEKTYTIDGVVADFHFNSLHTPIVPHVLFLSKVSKYVDENILVRVNAQNIEAAVDHIQKTVNELAPNVPVAISYLGDDLENLYKQEARLSKIVTILVTVSLLLSVVGLIALCSYMIEFRMREIAIRKVFGAATAGIIAIFAKVFVKTTFIAFAIAAPVCWVAMNRWMEEFAYREQISVSWFLYVLIGVLAITIGLAISQTIKAANMNPTKVLKE